MTRNSLHRLALLLLALLTLACDRSDKSEAAPTAARPLIVFAASSLGEAFGALGKEFERLHPGSRVSFNFAGTQELRTQLEHGAPADVFASADRHHMTALHPFRVFTPVIFARNEPVIIVSTSATTAIETLADLPKATRLVLGTPEVPIGRYSVDILEKASLLLGDDFRRRVEAKVVSRELNVRQVLAKVSLGEAEAGIVYRSDVHDSPKGIRAVAVPPAFTVFAEYPIAVVQGTAQRELAEAWIALVASKVGQDTLQANGFLPASPAPGP